MHDALNDDDDFMIQVSSMISFFFFFFKVLIRNCSLKCLEDESAVKFGDYLDQIYSTVWFNKTFLEIRRRIFP